MRAVYGYVVPDDVDTHFPHTCSCGLELSKEDSEFIGHGGGADWYNCPECKSSFLKIIDLGEVDE